MLNNINRVPHRDSNTSQSLWHTLPLWHKSFGSSADKAPYSSIAVRAPPISSCPIIMDIIDRTMPGRECIILIISLFQTGLELHPLTWIIVLALLAGASNNINRSKSKKIGTRRAIGANTEAHPGRYIITTPKLVYLNGRYRRSSSSRDLLRQRVKSVNPHPSDNNKTKVQARVPPQIIALNPIPFLKINHCWHPA